MVAFILYVFSCAHITGTVELLVSGHCQDQKRCPLMGGENCSVCTVEPRFNEVPDLTYKCFRPGQSHSKMYGEEPRFKVIPDITNKIWKTERKNYPDTTNKMSSRHRRRIRQEMKPIIFCLFSKNIVSSYPLHAAKQSVIIAI